MGRELPRTFPLELTRRSTLELGAKLATDVERLAPLVEGVIRHPKNAINNKHILSEALLLPSGAPLLTETYKMLTATMEDKSRSDEQRFTAYMIADMLLTQTGIPLRKWKAFEETDPTSKMGIALSQLADHLDETQKPTEHSLAAETALREVQESFITTAHVLPQVDDSEQRTKQEIDFATMLFNLSDTPIGTLWNEWGGPGYSTLYNQIYLRSLTHALRSPHLDALLFSDELREAPLSAQLFAWIKSSSNRIADKTEDPSLGRQLEDYFFTDEAIQVGFWYLFTQPSLTSAVSRYNENPVASLITHVPIEYLCSELFLLQNNTKIDEFWDTAKVELRPREEQEVFFRKFGGVIALFQTLHQGHENIQNLRKKILILAREVGREGIIETMLPVLEDQKPGIIYLTDTQEARVKYPKDGQSQEAFLSAHADRLIVYISQTTVPTRAVQQELVEKKNILVIPEGKAGSIEHWPNIARHTEGNRNKILAQVGQEFEALEPDVDHLLDLATDIGAQESSVRRKAAVMPALLDEGHPLRALDAIGIVSIQREGDQFAIVIDARKASIITSGSPIILLEGTIDANKDISIQGVMMSNLPDSLQLALQAALVFSEKSPQSTDRKKIKQTRLDGLVDAVHLWNYNREYPGLANQVPESENTGVVVAVSADEVMHLAFVGDQRTQTVDMPPRERSERVPSIKGTGHHRKQETVFVSKREQVAQEAARQADDRRRWEIANAARAATIPAPAVGPVLQIEHAKEETVISTVSEAAVVAPPLTEQERAALAHEERMERRRQEDAVLLQMLVGIPKRALGRSSRAKRSWTNLV